MQPNGDIVYRTSSGELPFDWALDANGNVLRAVAETCGDVDGGAQECTFRAAA
ncbi:MAG: hypothetical protein Q4A16_08120 [Lautropia sp.]|nr:hypothetical protein [Lautropia sp.]